MIRKRRVSEVMMSGVTTIQPGQSARQAQHLMRKQGVHALPVVGDDGKLLGIVTSTDLIQEHDPNSLVARFMSTEVITVEPQTMIEAAARRMLENEVHHLVVLEGGKLVGVLSTFDILYSIGKGDVPRRHAMVESGAAE